MSPDVHSFIVPLEDAQEMMEIRFVATSVTFFNEFIKFVPFWAARNVISSELAFLMVEALFTARFFLAYFLVTKCRMGWISLSQEVVRFTCVKWWHFESNLFVF